MVRGMFVEAARGAEDAGVQLGAEGGVFVPVEADFGNSGSDAAAWVDPQKGQGKGGKGRKGYGKKGR